ncbi:MAG: ECF transporter S component, partial [Herbiconiux sp.]|nr:ECF transporter S component [Herbiconiux sp.]
GVAVGIWLIGGVIGGLVIRKPGAALVVEIVAAVISMLIGNVWGVSTVLSGIVQGFGAELIFALFFYRRFGIVVAALAGVGAAAAAWVFELFYGSSPNILKSFEFNTIYLVSIVVSGAILAGVVGWLLVRALAVTGALNRFAAGREVTARA